MKLRLWSDIHREFRPLVPSYTDEDKEIVLVIAGDLCPYHVDDGVQFFTDLAPHYRDILYVPGNHEYYREGIRKVDTHFKNLESIIPNFHYMNPDSLVIDGIKFVGATLWTDFHQRDPLDMMYAREAMSDFHIIKNDFHGYRKFTPEDSTIINYQHRKFFEDCLQGWVGKSVIISHHAPIGFQAIRRGRDLDWAFYNTNLESFIEKYKPTYWLHGHTHTQYSEVFAGTTIVSNPRGYPNEPVHQTWNERFTLEI